MSGLEPKAKTARELLKIYDKRMLRVQWRKAALERWVRLEDAQQIILFQIGETRKAATQIIKEKEERLERIRSLIDRFSAKIEEQLSDERHIWKSTEISEGARSFCFGRLSLLEGFILKELERLKKEAQQ